MLCREKWLVGLFAADSPAPLPEFLKQRLLHSLVKALICWKQMTDCCLLNSQALHDQILQQNIASAGIFLVQIRITRRAFSKKSFLFLAFHLCSLQTTGRKELSRQILPQKYKDMYLLGRTEIQKSRRQSWDSEVHPNLLCFSFLEYYPPSIEEISANYFYSPIPSGSASVAFFLHNPLNFFVLPFPVFCRQSHYFLSFPSERL